MGLFSFFRKKSKIENAADVQETIVPKDLFIDESDPVRVAMGNAGDGMKGIEAVYSFLQADYEGRGYNDALTNPDDSYKADNLTLLRQDLVIIIQRAETWYESNLRELDFHIETRGRAGLIDIVEELKMRRELVLGYLEKLGRIRTDAMNRDGLTERISLSYRRGFTRGLAAITQSRVLSQRL